MFGFGNKDKKVQQASERGKERLVTMLDQLASSCGNAEVAQKAKDIVSILNRQGTSKDQNVVAYDAEIQKHVNAARSYVAGKSIASALNSLENAQKYVSERGKLCSIGGTKTKADIKQDVIDQKLIDKLQKKTPGLQKSRSEELLEQLAEENAKLSGLNVKFAELARKSKIANSQALQAEGAIVKTEINKSINAVKAIRVELEREVGVEAMIDLTELFASLESGRTVSDDQIELQKNRFLEMQGRQAGTQEVTNQLNTILGNSASAAIGGDVFADFNAAGTGDVFADFNGQQASSDPLSAFGGGASDMFGESNIFADVNSGPNAEKREIARVQKEMEKSLDMYNDKIEEFETTLHDYNAELRPLLLRRKSASPSECLTLDGKIDQLNAKRNTVQYAIRRYRQAAATLQEQLSIVDKVGIQKVIESTKAAIARISGGKAIDFEGLAMYLKDSVQKGNEELEEMGAAAAVSDSEEISMNTFSGSTVAYGDLTGTTDEHKYDDLMRDLGLAVN